VKFQGETDTLWKKYNQVSKKRKFATKKKRTEMIKRCKDKKCEMNQHFETPQEAEWMSPFFETLKGKSTNCLCGCQIQFYHGHKWSAVQHFQKNK
jgi:hypothetical protein